MAPEQTTDMNDKGNGQMHLYTEAKRIAEEALEECEGDEERAQ